MHSAYVGGSPARRAILATSREPRCRFTLPVSASHQPRSRPGGHADGKPWRGSEWLTPATAVSTRSGRGLIMAGRRRAAFIAVTAAIALAAVPTAVATA